MYLKYRNYKTRTIETEIPVETLYDGELIFFPLREYFARFLKPHVIRRWLKFSHDKNWKNGIIKYTISIKVERYKTYKTRNPIATKFYRSPYSRKMKEQILHDFSGNYSIRRIRRQRYEGRNSITLVFEVVKGRGYQQFDIKLLPQSTEYELVADDKAFSAKKGTASNVSENKE